MDQYISAGIRIKISSLEVETLPFSFIQEGRLIFDHGLLHVDLDFHSISINSTAVPIKILDQFNHLSHPSLYEVKFPCPKEWTFEEGEQVTVGSSEKEATIAAVKSTYLEVELATDEGIEAVSWYMSGMSSPLGTLLVSQVVH